jgi:CheY-like chemotaxis protein
MQHTAPELLLVDDNHPDIRLFEELCLDRIGWPRVSVAYDGEQALDFLFQRNQYENAPRPDLIVLDLNLPKLSGIEVLSAIRSEPSLRDIPVIVLSVCTSPFDVQEAYRLNVAGYIEKPKDLAGYCDVSRALARFWAGALTRISAA